MIFYTYCNLGYNQFVQGNFKVALDYYNSAEKIPIKLYQPKTYRILYQLKISCLDSLGFNNLSSAYSKSKSKLDSLLNDIKVNYIYYETDAKYQNQELSQKLTTLEKITKNLQRYKWFYIVGLIITFLLALYSFIRWKRTDKIKQKVLTEKSKIEQEHQQTLTQINNMKQLVIKEHITLKNKSKVYLSDLIYLKSEDHYLQLFTTNKKEFVRGKISDIIKQLPPNFVQTHRSYIVNRNFIQTIGAKSIQLKDKTEIPISRKYKPNIT